MTDLDVDLAPLEKPLPPGAGVPGLPVAVLGSGAWGTTFAAVMADAGCDVALWGRRRDVADAINARHANPAYLPDIELPTGLRATTDAVDAVRGARIVAVAIPSQHVRTSLAPFRELIEPDAIVVSLVKGVELGTDRRMSELLGEVLGVPPERVAVVSGPNLAREIARQQPTATVVSSIDEETARTVGAACSTGYFRAYTNTDVIGVELCGAAKNVIALVVGIAQGAGYGYNTMATVITRGLVEITRLGLAVGAHAETFAGLAGMGDLVATCASPLSRNHTLGKHVGEGMSVEEATRVTGGTAEGVRTCRSILELAQRRGVEVPITAAAVAITHEGRSVDAITRALIGRQHPASLPA
jgi:glycerol-3-phosphate dehydrogenase (NAD(P)+)